MLSCRQRISPTSSLSELSRLKWKSVTLTAQLIAHQIEDGDEKSSARRTIFGGKVEAGDYLARYHDLNYSASFSYFNLDTAQLILPKEYFEANVSRQRGENGFTIFEFRNSTIAAVLDYPGVWAADSGEEIEFEPGSLLLFHTAYPGMVALEIWPAQQKRMTGSLKFTATADFGEVMPLAEFFR